VVRYTVRLFNPRRSRLVQHYFIPGDGKSLCGTVKYKDTSPASTKDIEHFKHVGFVVTECGICKQRKK